MIAAMIARRPDHRKFTGLPVGRERIESPHADNGRLSRRGSAVRSARRGKPNQRSGRRHCARHRQRTHSVRAVRARADADEHLPRRRPGEGSKGARLHLCDQRGSFRATPGNPTLSPGWRTAAQGSRSSYPTRSRTMCGRVYHYPSGSPPGSLATARCWACCRAVHRNRRSSPRFTRASNDFDFEKLPVGELPEIRASGRGLPG